MSDLAYLGIAFGVVWLGIAAYVLSIARRQHSLERRMDELKRDKTEPE